MAEFPNIDACDPRQCISSRVLKCNRIISGVFRKYIKPFNLTNSQLSVLFILSKKGAVTQQELANMLYLEKSTVSRNLKRLFDAKYIQKTAPKTIEITPLGKRFLEEVIPAWELAMEEARKLIGLEGDQALTILLNQLIKK